MKRYIILFLNLLCLLQLHATDKLTLSTAENTLSIALENDASFTSFQMDVTIPMGMNVTSVNPTERIAPSSFVVDSEMVGSNVLRVIAYNTDNQPMAGNDGELLNISLSATPKAVDVFEVKNIRFVKTSNLSEILLDNVSTVLQETPEDPDDDPDDAPTDISKYDNIIYINPVEANAGDNVTLSVRMKNKMNVAGFQMNLYLPDGFNVTKVARGERVKVLNDDDEYIYTFQNSTYPDGSRYLLCYSTANEAMSGNDGEIAQITISVPESAEAGEYPIIIKDGEMSYGSDYELIKQFKTTLTVKDYIEGDANCDGRVSVADITTVASYLLGKTPSVFNAKAADANADTRISVADITTIAQKLLGGGQTQRAKGIRYIY